MKNKASTIMSHSEMHDKIEREIKANNFLGTLASNDKVFRGYY